MTERVQYLIAQYQTDPFRKEPRNVGVVARMDGRTLTRFLGEDEAGLFDRRKLRSMQFPDVYLQWVDYWREVSKDVRSLEELLDSNQPNYSMVRGGKVHDTGTDSLEEVVDHLFTRFVGRGFAEAMRKGDQVVVTSRKLANAIEIELVSMDILVEDDLQKEGVLHPVRRKHAIMGGGSVVFRPEFSQENGALYLIETFDFTGSQAKRLHDHAGYTAYMYRDMRSVKGPGKLKAISVVKTDPEAEENEHIENSRKMLKRESEVVVDWNDEAQRKAFLEERRQVAVG